MLVPSGQLSPLQQQLLREMDLCDLPAPGTAPETYAARDLDTDEVRDAVAPLLWAELVEQCGGAGGALRLTPLGALALRTAECDDLTARLGAVSSFAETVSMGAPSRIAAHALKLLAEGTWTLEQAEAYVCSGEVQDGEAASS